MGHCLQKTLIFIQIIFGVHKFPLSGGNNLENLSNISRESWFIPLGHLLKFLSQLGSSFFRKRLKKLFSCISNTFPKDV